MLAAHDKDARALATLLERLVGAPHSYYGAGRGALAAYPPLSGADVAAEVDAHPPFGRFQLSPEPLIRAGLATAALPRPTPIAWTRADLDAEAELGARALRRAGLDVRGRSSDCLEGGLVTPGTLAVTDALDALDALALPVGPVTAAAALQRAAEVWEIVRPQTLIVDAASLAFLHGAGGYPRPRTFAVLLTPANAAELAAAPRTDVCRIFSVPQICTFVAGECAVQNGFHVTEDAVLAEIVDDTGAPCRDGAAGRLLLTTLTRSLALVRFDTGLRAVHDASACSCGDVQGRVHFRA